MTNESTQMSIEPEHHPEEPPPEASFWDKFVRARRSVLGSLVSKMLGEEAISPDQSIKKDIEESGLVGGITERIKKTTDEYVNQKLDEIEARIDRKLDEIDRRLSEWRDKELANRIRILKITLWASVVVSALSLLYLYLKTYFLK